MEKKETIIKITRTIDDKGRPSYNFDMKNLFGPDDLIGMLERVLAYFKKIHQMQPLPKKQQKDYIG